MSWEDETEADAFTIKPTSTVALGQFDDEDIDGRGEAKDSWEDEDEVPEPKDDTPKTFSKVSLKKPAGKQKLKKEDQKIAEEDARAPVKPLTYEEKRARQDTVEKEDLENAKDIFDGVDADNDDLFGSSQPTPKLAALDLNPTSPAEFIKYGTLLAERVTPYKDAYGYTDCLKQFLKDSTVALDPEEIKELVAKLNVIVNDRIKAQQPTSKKKRAAVKKAATKKEVVRVDNEYSDFLS